ncbi:MAG: 2-succinyl-5-enolpyruvyl-6-hydroxy-3-cyclohexene-1-carboxylic-acid synthase [Myxococcota bacterium]
MEGTEILMAAFARGLAEAGIGHACISPGSRSTPLALALLSAEGVRCWSHVDERAGGYFGLGIAKATGKPVALLCTSGTAAAGFYPAAIEARHAGVPLVILTADRPPELRECGAGQTIDQIKLYGDAVKWFFELSAPDAGDASVRFFRSLGARAAATAAAAPPGPVHLNVPLRDPLTPPPAHLEKANSEAAARDPRPALKHSAGRLAPPPAVVRATAGHVAAAPAGIIVCGDAGPAEGLADAIAALARAAGYPVLADVPSGLRAGTIFQEEAGDLLVDAYDTLLRAAPFSARHAPALTIRVGAMPTSKALLACLQETATPSARHVLVDPHGEQRDPLHVATDVIRADPEMFCRALAEEIGKGRAGRSSWEASWQAANDRARRAVQSALDDLEEPFEGRVARDLAAALPAGAALFVGSSMPIRDLEAFFPGRTAALRVLANRGANGIDGVVSTALGVAAVSRKPVALLTGDLGFLHDLGGLLAARRYGVPLVIVVVNNDGGGIFHFLPQAGQVPRFEEFFATPHGLDLSKAANLYGLGHHAVNDARGLAPALEAALAAGGARVIEVRTDAKRNVELHAAIQKRAIEALGDG